MLHWLQSLLPHIPHYGYLFVFIVVFLNNIGVPLPGETILLGAGFVFAQFAASLGPPMVAGTSSCFLGGVCSFWIGRRLGHSRLERIHWLHLSPASVKWPEQFFKRFGAKAVFIARFIPLFPPAIANLFAGMSKMPWRIYLFYDLTGSAVYTASYLLLGYFFGKRWKIIEAWMGTMALYLVLTVAVLILLGVIFRHPLSRFWGFAFSRTGTRK